MCKNLFYVKDLVFYNYVDKNNIVRSKICVSVTKKRKMFRELGHKMKVATMGMYLYMLRFFLVLKTLITICGAPFISPLIHILVDVQHNTTMNIMVF